MELPKPILISSKASKINLDEDPIFKIPDNLLNKGDDSWYPFVLDPKFEPRITEATINLMMSCDEIFRGRDGKFVGWPLFREEEIYATLLYYMSNFEREERVPLDLKMPIYQGGWIPDPKISDPNQWRNRLVKNYPLIDKILELGQGHLIVAGGAITSAINGNKSGDCDFFFIGYNNEEDAFNLLREVVEYIENYVQNSTKEHGSEEVIYITRSQNVTTIHIPHSYEKPTMKAQTLQFVHRIYPDMGNLETNISLVIGGFDLFSCAIAYYNQQFYATPAGVFSLANRLNIVMTSRFSTSMAKRLEKYRNKGFKILFPGTTRKIMSKKSLAAKHAYHNSKEMPINLPYMKFGFRATSEFDDEADYEVKNTEGQIGILSKKFNLNLLASGKFEQYCVYGNTWNEIFYPKAFANNPVIGETKFKGYTRTINDKLIAKTIESLTQERYFGAQDWANPNVSLALSIFRHRIFEIFGKILHFELETWLDTSKTAKIVMFNVTFFKLETKEFDYLKDLRWRIKTFENFSQKEKDQILQIYQKAMRNLVRRCCDELICLNNASMKIFTKACLPKLTTYVKRGEIEAIANLHEKPCMSSKNPMRQHTASFNPIPSSAVDWYGVENYVPFRVGFPDEIYFLVKQMGIRYGISMQVIVPYFARAWAEGQINLFKKDVMDQFSNNMNHAFIAEIGYFRNLVSDYRDDIVDIMYKGHSNSKIREIQTIPKLPKIMIVASEETKAKLEKQKNRRARKRTQKLVKTRKAIEEQNNDLPLIESPRGFDKVSNVSFSKFKVKSQEDDFYVLSDVEQSRKDDDEEKSEKDEEE